MLQAIVRDHSGAVLAQAQARGARSLLDWCIDYADGFIHAVGAVIDRKGRTVGRVETDYYGAVCLIDFRRARNGKPVVLS